MRPLWKDILIAVWLGIILPGIVLNLLVLLERQWKTEQAQAEQIQAVPVGTVCQNDIYISVLNPEMDVVNMELDSYLTGVLLAEMPAEFHEEALKAQSVAARTYTWKAHVTGGKHGDGSVCSDSGCCQAFVSEEDYLALGGTQEHLEKVRQAVLATSDFVMAYEGELIEATYFSSSGGRTESAMAVWGVDYPYLMAVSSPEEDYVDSMIFHKTEFENLLGGSFSGDPSQWFGSVSYTDGGGVEYMEIGGVRYSGVQLRSILGLRSTVFRIELQEDKIVITTRGYGHRVGMSQYGANAMAQTGSTWQEILQHYYPGITVIPIS